MVSKRQLERKLAGLEEGATTERDRIEMCFDGMYAYEPEPRLTNALEERGFVVERDIREYADSVMILLQPTPSAGGAFEQISWHRDGPTADHNDIRIIWEADRLEQVRADAEHPTVYTEPDVPDEMERTVVAEGDGWEAVIPSDRLIMNMVHRRSEAEYHGFDILGPVELPLENAEQYDLVEVDPIPTRNASQGIPTYDRKRELEKRLEHLEAKREAKQTTKPDRFDGEIDETEVKAVIEFARHRLRDPDSVPAEVVASVPADVRDHFGVQEDDGES